ncbi:hypothetical protein [Streptomyces ardesiacus]|uniref:hypothetical protein n=1 Tax=Streptomyces ardesiacus TaxID=285564 RepID=UPI00369B1BB2
MNQEADPRWSPDVRMTVQMAMNAVVREAADIVQRRSDGGRWVPPREIDEVGSNSALCTAARVWVLDKLDAQIREARQVLDQVEADCRAQAGVVIRPHQGDD